MALRRPESCFVGTPERNEEKGRFLFISLILNEMVCRIITNLTLVADPIVCWEINVGALVLLGFCSASLQLWAKAGLKAIITFSKLMQS